MPVPKANLAACKRIVRNAAECGSSVLEYHEYVASAPGHERPGTGTDQPRFGGTNFNLPAVGTGLGSSMRSIAGAGSGYE